MGERSGEAQYVTIGLGEEVFGLDVAHVREIRDYARPAALPDGPPYLLGLIDVRGRSTPTLDLRARLGLTRSEPDLDTRTLVTDVPVAGKVLSLGLVADRVIEVATVRRDEIEPAPDIGGRWRSDYIAGVVRRDGGFVVLLDLRALLTGAGLPEEALTAA